MNWRDDKNLIVNSFFIILFSIVVLFISWIHPNDGQTYQTFVSLLSGFSGALLMDMKGSKTTPPVGSTTVTQVEQIIETDKKENNSI